MHLDVSSLVTISAVRVHVNRGALSHGDFEFRACVFFSFGCLCTISAVDVRGVSVLCLMTVFGSSCLRWLPQHNFGGSYPSCLFEIFSHDDFEFRA